MAEPLFGTDAMFYMEIDSVMTLLLCATEFSYEITAEMIEKTGPNSDGSRERMRRLEDHKSTITGLFTVINDQSVSMLYVMDKSVRRAEHNFKISFIDSDANEKDITGAGIFGTLSLSSPSKDFVTGTIELFWQGTPVITDSDGVSDSGVS